MEHPDNTGRGICLNCEAVVNGKYCSNCGQKFQPTRLPLRIYLEDTVETLFNIDNRVFRTMKDLFFKPGRVTADYIAGKRASYLPPLRVYISISVVYFLVVYLTDSREVFFVNMGEGQAGSGLAKWIQYGLFVLVPIFAWISKLFHRKRGGFYVEYLIFAIHIHCIWFVLYSLSALSGWSRSYWDIQEGTFIYYLLLLLDILFKASVFGYLIVNVKRVFGQKWWKALLKSMGILFVYLIFFAVTALAFLFIKATL